MRCCGHKHRTHHKPDWLRYNCDLRIFSMLLMALKAQYELSEYGQAHTHCKKDKFRAETLATLSLTVLLIRRCAFVCECKTRGWTTENLHISIKLPTSASLSWC